MKLDMKLETELNMELEMDESIYDYDRALQDFGSDLVLREALRTYLETVDPMVDTIRTSYHKGDPIEVRRGVHWLKGGLSYLHASRVRDACLALYELSLQDPLPPLEDSIQHLEDEMRLLTTTLQPLFER